MATTAHDASGRGGLAVDRHCHMHYRQGLPTTQSLPQREPCAAPNMMASPPARVPCGGAGAAVVSPSGQRHRQAAARQLEAADVRSPGSAHAGCQPERAPAAPTRAAQVLGADTVATSGRATPRNSHSKRRTKRHSELLTSMSTTPKALSWAEMPALANAPHRHTPYTMGQRLYVINQCAHLNNNKAHVPAGFTQYEAVAVRNNVNRKTLSDWWRDREKIREHVENGYARARSYAKGVSNKRAWHKDSGVLLSRIEWMAFETKLARRITDAGDAGVDTHLPWVLRQAAILADENGIAGEEGERLQFHRKWAAGFFARHGFTARNGVDNDKQQTVEERIPAVTRWHEQLWQLQAGLIGRVPLYKLPADAKLTEGCVVSVKFPIAKDPDAKPGTIDASDHHAWFDGCIMAPLPTCSSSHVFEIYFPADGKTETHTLARSTYGKKWVVRGECHSAHSARTLDPPLWVKLGYSPTGRFKPSEVGNFDQAPLYFDHNRPVYIKCGHKRTRNQQKVLADRIGTITLLLTADGQCHVMCIFHGTHEAELKSKRSQAIKDEFAAAKALGVFVTLQRKAWHDGNVSMELFTDVLPEIWPRVEGHTDLGTEKRLLVGDNLSAQTGEEYVRLARENSSTLLRFLPPNCTDMLQPVDANIAKLVQDYVCNQYELWVEEPAVVARMQVGPTFSAAERRKLAVKWVSEGVRKKLTPERIRRAFRKTGTYIAADGSVDTEVEPQHATEKVGYVFDSNKVTRAPTDQPRLEPFGPVMTKA